MGHPLIRTPAQVAILAALVGVAAVVSGCLNGPPGAADAPLDYAIELMTVRGGFDAADGFIWTQAYVGGIHSGGAPPEIVVTMSQHFTRGVDDYGDLYEARSADGGETWTAPTRIPALRRTQTSPAAAYALSDLYLGWHEASGRLLGTGKLFIYDLTTTDEDKEAARRAAYTVLDPATDTWSPPRTLLFPERDHTGAPLLNPNAGCTQRIDLPGGDILLPIYYVRAPEHAGDDELNVSTVARVRFDGDSLRYVAHGSEHTLPQGRGFGEPSVAFYEGRYYLTLRNDESAYVTSSDDGLHYAEPVRWTFDDGEWLGSYNTQTHWLAHSDGLFLVYTRRGADNDHIFRHRAPLFMARVDPERLVVLRETERVLIPERGARLGNFGVTHLDAHTSLVSVAERMQDASAAYGADNSVFVAKVRWSRPNRLFGSLGRADG